MHAVDRGDPLFDGLLTPVDSIFRPSRSGRAAHHFQVASAHTGDRQGVGIGVVGLQAVAAIQRPHAGRQLGWHVEDVLTLDW